MTPLRPRLMGIVMAAALVALPAAILRVACVGSLCRDPDPEAEVPFCSLGPVRELIRAGWREENSPDVIGVTAPSVDLLGGRGRSVPAHPLWPSRDADARVPLAIFGPHLSGSVPEGTTLDRVAPTLAELAGLDRPHPEVRTGTPIASYAASRRPALLVGIVVVGLGTPDLERDASSWANLMRQMDESGTLDAGTGSLPLDPVAILTSIGTGGLPWQHGMTGAKVRNDEGRVVDAWSREAPFSVIATLGDDLDEGLKQRPRIGLVTPHPSYRGVIGGSWYLDVDEDDVVVTKNSRIELESKRILKDGYGRDRVPDLFVAVVNKTSTSDQMIRDVLKAAADVSDNSFAAFITGTGTNAPSAERTMQASELIRDLENALPGQDRMLAGAGPSGFFLDPGALEEQELSSRAVVTFIAKARDDEGRMVFSDVFPKIAVAFAEYC